MGLLPLRACVIFARGRHGDQCLCLKQLHTSIIDTLQVLQRRIVFLDTLHDRLRDVFVATALLL